MLPAVHAPTILTKNRSFITPRPRELMPAKLLDWPYSVDDTVAHDKRYDPTVGQCSSQVVLSGSNDFVVPPMRRPSRNREQTENRSTSNEIQIRSYTTCQGHQTFCRSALQFRPKSGSHKTIIWKREPDSHQLTTSFHPSPKNDLQLALKIDSPGKVECWEMLEASTMLASMSFSVGAPISRKFISNSSWKAATE